MTDKLQAYFAWKTKENARIGHEWARFEGTPEQGVELADKQTERLVQAIERIGCEAEVKDHYSGLLNSA